VSLVDTTNRVRYGPLRVGSIDGAPYSSNIGYLFQSVGSTYRVAGFYPDPGAGVTSMGVDLQLAGIAPAIPIVDGGQTAPDLFAAGSRGAPSPDPMSSGGKSNGAVVTWTTPVPGPDAYVDKHNLIAKVAGGTVNESADHNQGIVTVNADLLFAFNSAKLSARAGALITQARSILTAKANPAKPVTVIGYTDDKGSDAFNRNLSRKRANAAATALRRGSLGPLRLTVSGRGENDPVGPNTTPDGGDNPRGRALNRRVEITYAPKPVPVAPSAAPATTAPDVPATNADRSPGPVVTLPTATVKSSGLPSAPMFAAIHPIVEDGTLSLVSVDITAKEDTLVIDAFTGHLTPDEDIGAFTIVDPATKRVYLPAYDEDDQSRVMGTYTHRLGAGVPEHYAFYAAELPQGLASATVDLDQLGSAKNISITR
jgi:outer membrane protein OmpA-like peptidoglycan-associated protein